MIPGDIFQFARLSTNTRVGWQNATAVSGHADQLQRTHIKAIVICRAASETASTPAETILTAIRCH
jgi:hypothetical protein